MASDRASGRVRDLRGSVLSRLRGHSQLAALLERAVDNAGDVIVPAATADMWHRDDQTADPPAVALAVSAVTGSSARENRQERKSLVIQTDLQIQAAALRQEGLPWNDEILDEVSAVLTSHAAGWTARGESGGTPEPLWDEDLNRYRSVQRFDIESWG